MRCFRKTITSMELIKTPCVLICASVVGMNLSLFYFLIQNWNNAIQWCMWTVSLGTISILLSVRKHIHWTNLIMIYSTIDCCLSFVIRSCFLIYFCVNPFVLCELFEASELEICAARVQNVAGFAIAFGTVYSFLQLGTFLYLFGHKLQVVSEEDMNDEKQAHANDMEYMIDSFPAKPIHL
ncbi:hypothetical protein SJAG_02088 [Schizosaccharomyces japonicus yFS275]|uniref:Uncharacterized protein n=1 Tax=Schizosaccharomyces japonicus (strain yFS275 / FY16936) TaxID=402676 RepID=B6JZP6_SCHJY|nr:hypothetical protein SJAG_02088 [Schizosaccharomyces japonicus yFS275]EEB07014.1 hypothetical protein SJAG_02088 [Schizosaccharomyces japonicus yFS275]